MRRSPAWAALAFACLFCVGGAAAAPALEHPPEAPPALRDELLAGIRAIEGQINATVQAHPDLFPALPPSPWKALNASEPFWAFRLAAAALADLRVRVVLKVPQGTTMTPLDDQEINNRVSAWNNQLQTNASALVQRMERKPVPAPGPALEEIMLRHLPAYEIVIRANSVFAIRPQSDARLLLEAMAQLEARRVAWEQIQPTVPSGPNGLPQSYSESVYQNASFRSAKASSLVRDGKSAIQVALARHLPFAALEYVIATEEGYVQENATASASDPAFDLRSQLAADYARLYQANASALEVRAFESAFESAAASDASPSTVDAMADALGQLSALRMMRGLPVVNVAPATTATTGASSSSPGGESSSTVSGGRGAPGLGLGAIVAAVAVAILATRRRR